jgi:hypothetical protein
MSFTNHPRSYFILLVSVHMKIWNLTLGDPYSHPDRSISRLLSQPQKRRNPRPPNFQHSTAVSMKWGRACIRRLLFS